MFAICIAVFILAIVQSIPRGERVGSLTCRGGPEMGGNTMGLEISREKDNWVHLRVRIPMTFWVIPIDAPEARELADLLDQASATLAKP